MIMCHWDPNNTQPKNDAQVNNKGSGTAKIQKEHMIMCKIPLQKVLYLFLYIARVKQHS